MNNEASQNTPYSKDQPTWSGKPNDALMRETEGLAPSTALDIGAGEGADAIWLAQRGWEVTAVEKNHIAVERARERACRADLEVSWIENSVEDVDFGDDTFALVTCSYVFFPKTEEELFEKLLTSRVAPGGTLLVVMHADFDFEHARSRGLNPEEHLSFEDIRDYLDSEWSIQVADRRERNISGGAGARYRFDLVLKAVKGIASPESKD